MNSRLDGKVAVVTGAAGDGIGRAIAAAFAHEGADVAVLDIRDASETIERVRSFGIRAIAVESDLSDAMHARQALETISTQLGPVDVLVNAAAVIHRKPFLDLTLDEWDQVHAVNLRSYFVTGQWVARQMVSRGAGGSIINVASVGALVATPDQAHYCAAKGGVLQLTRTMAVELARFGIRVNAISPGPIETDINRTLLADPAFRAMRVAPVPLGRVGLPHEVTGLALLLASDAGSYITGANMVVDGGLTAL